MTKSETKAPQESVPAGPPVAAPGETLETVLAAARIAAPVLDLANGAAYAFVPRGFELRDVSDPHRLPPYIKQSLVVDDAESLIHYANRFSDARSIIIANLDTLTIGAVLDWHSGNQEQEYDPLAPMACQHVARLVLRQSEEFARWAEMEGRLHDQMAFAEFLDENASDIVDPEPAVMIEIARDLEAVQGAKFKANTRLQTGERSFSYETETHVKGDLKVPQRFRLAIPLFGGEEPTEIEASFRFRPQPDGLKLGFVWRRVEYVRQAKFREIAYRVAEHTGLPVFQGRVP